MTPLEAIAHGVPPVLLDTPVAREVYGDGARLVPLESGRDRRRARRAADRRRARTPRCVAAGRARLARYSWARRPRRRSARRSRRRPAADMTPRPRHHHRQLQHARRTRSRCLASLIDAPPGRPARDVVVVDNASTDGSVDAVRAALARGRGHRARPERRVRRREQRRACAQPTAPLVLLLNSDTRRAGRRDRHAGRRGSSATGAVAAGPRLVDADGRPEVSFGPMLSPLAEARAAAARPAGRAATAAGAARLRRAAGRRASARSTGSAARACWCAATRPWPPACFDERYFLYEEDVDFCAACARAAAACSSRRRPRSCTCAADRGAPATGRGASHYDRSHLAFYEKHAPRWAPLAAALAAAARPAHPIESRAERIRAHRDRRPQAARLRHRHVRPQPRPRAGAAGRRRRVRAALPRRRDVDVRRVARAALRAARRARRQLLACASRSACRCALRARARRSVPRAALRRLAADDRARSS